MKTLFIYSKPSSGFSGQAAATALIIEGFEGQSKNVDILNTPHLDRAQQSSAVKMYLDYLCSLLGCWFKALRYRFCKLTAIHLTLGQTRVAMLRDGISLMLCSAFRGKSVCTSGAALNGSVFAAWSYSSLEARLFRWVIGQCHFVTCLGEHHRGSLINLGIPKSKVRIVPNVCEYDGLDSSVVQEKHTTTGQPIRILYLSSLIDTKGFPEYLEALHALSTETKLNISATLCGPITMSPYSERFTSSQEVRAWIESLIDSINTSNSVRVEWIEGAVGRQKCDLFEQAHIFVLPTRYKVEAQPLAVIEAMAFGCAIITSNVGELPSTVDVNSAIILSKPDSVKVAKAIQTLCSDNDLRLNLAQGGLMRFHQDFNREAYIDHWNQLLYN